jgi:hypothetical protein
MFSRVILLRVNELPGEAGTEENGSKGEPDGV